MIGMAALGIMPAAPARAQPSTSGAVAVQGDVEALAAAAERAGLPGERLRQKAQEGAAKGIAAPRVLAVLAQMRLHMDEAAALVDVANRGAAQPLAAKQRRDLVDAALGARQVGVSSSALAALANAGLTLRRDPAALQGALVAVGDLVARGFDAPTCEELVELALAQGFSAPELARLARTLHDLAGDGNPGEAMQNMRASLRAGHRPPGFEAGKGGPLEGPVPGRARGKDVSRGRDAKPRPAPLRQQ